MKESLKLMLNELQKDCSEGCFEIYISPTEHIINYKTDSMVFDMSNELELVPEGLIDELRNHLFESWNSPFHNPERLFCKVTEGEFNISLIL